MYHKRTKENSAQSSGKQGLTDDNIPRPKHCVDLIR